MKAYCTQNTDRECREDDCCLNKTQEEKTNIKFDSWIREEVFLDKIIIDNVNHPPHYNSSKAECLSCKRRIECIDITRHMNFNIGNAFKYLWRAEHKGGKEDLQKAIWYLQNEIDKK